MNENSPDHPHEPPDDVDYPSTLRITSKPFEEATEEGLDRLDEWEGGADVPHVVNFADASRLQRVLTDRRLELVRSLMDEPAESIRDLAARLGRDVRQVHDDVRLLAEYGIVRFTEDGRAKKPFVPYDTVRIEVELRKPPEDRSGSPASA